MELKLYWESLKEESRAKHFRSITIYDFREEIQQVIRLVWEFGDSVTYYDNDRQYARINKKENS